MFDFLSLRRASVPAPGEARRLFNTLAHSHDRPVRCTPPKPRVVHRQVLLAPSKPSQCGMCKTLGECLRRRRDSRRLQTWLSSLQCRESNRQEPPQTVLERISNSGGNTDEVASTAWAQDLPEAIEGHWRGSRPREEQAQAPRVTQMQQTSSTLLLDSRCTVPSPPAHRE